MRTIEDWLPEAVCRQTNPDALFVPEVQQKIAKRLCDRCPVRYECLAEALDERIEAGVWGGMTERERRALLRRYPHVTSWAKVFDRALDHLGIRVKSVR